MKEILETMPRIELALIIIGVFALILGIIFVYAMIHEYRMYLEEPDSIPVSSQGTSEEFEDSIHVSSQVKSVDD